MQRNKISAEDIAHFRFVVIGSGFSGAVFAERIASELKERVLVLEKRDHIGGNAYDFKENGITVQRYGPHIFHTKYKDVWEYTSQFTEFHTYEHRVLAYIKGHFVPLPFNFAGIDAFFKKAEAGRIKEALIKEFGENSRVSVLELLNSHNALIHKLGDFVYENVFLHYTMKQWGVAPEQVDKSVISRVPVNISYADTYFSDPFQGIPRGGYTKLFEKLLENDRISVMLNTSFADIFKVDTEKGRIIFRENGEEFNGFVIYTGQIDRLFQYRFGALNYRSLQFMFETHNLEFYQKAAVVNYPNDFDFTRITEFKHFYNEKTKNTIIAKEYPCTLNEGKEPYYPFLNKKNILIYKKYAALARTIPKLIPLGRLANFKYINMDEAIKNALALFEKHFSQ